MKKSGGGTTKFFEAPRIWPVDFSPLMAVKRAASKSQPCCRYSLIAYFGILFTVGVTLSMFSLLQRVALSAQQERQYLMGAFQQPSPFFTRSSEANADLYIRRAELMQRDEIPSHPVLTIAVDHRGSCPDKCAFAHKILPPWVRYRYIDFDTEVDLTDMFDNDPIEQANPSHVLFVVRTNVINLSKWAVERREKHGVSIGLWHMADERIYGGEIQQPYYARFDYVIRNYYPYEPYFTMATANGPIHDMNLHALGNYTCGTSPTKLPTVPRTDGGKSLGDPRWGLHWAFLDTHSLHVLFDREATSVWPTSRRYYNCSFIGRPDVKRMQKQRSIMADTIKQVVPDLNCSIEITSGFAAGKEPWEYITQDLTNTKIGLAPRGSALETHRLPELLRMGAVPALIDEPYLHATFQSVPGILGDNWTQVAEKMRDLIVDERNGGQKLQELSQKGAKFFQQLQECMRSDMDVILRGAFSGTVTPPHGLLETYPTAKT